MIFYSLFLFFLLLSSQPLKAEPHCLLPDVYPYAPKSTYRGVHANRENNNRIACDGPAQVKPSYLALKGNVVFQPLSFSADGKKVYATILGTESCNLYEVTLSSGATRCFGLYDQTVGFGTVEVDSAGDLYFVEGRTDPVTGVQSTNVYSLTSEGITRWKVNLPHRVGGGVHFTKDGYIAQIHPDGVVTLITRESGSFVADFNLPISLGLHPSSPDSTVFTTNTIASTINNQLLSILDSQEGAILVALNIEKSGTLTLAWRAILGGTSSNTSPSVTADGHYIAVGDNQAGLYLVDGFACNATPSNCAPLWRYGLATSLLGNVAIDESGTVYAWNQTPNPDIADVFAIRTVVGSNGKALPLQAWFANFPGNSVWTSAITVLNNYLLGTVSTLNGLKFTHELVAIDQRNGKVLWKIPTDDDSINSVAFGPDGALYVPFLSFIDRLYPRDRAFSGGIRRYVPSL